MRLIDADAIQICTTSEVMKHIVTDLIDAQPTIDAASVKRGSWTEEYDETQPVFFKRLFRCSACNRTNAYGKSAFCPCCGADMRGEEEHETEAR